MKTHRTSPAKERVGRLFWKFFVLITVFQLGADLLVRAWRIERQHIVMIFHSPLIAATDREKSQQPLSASAELFRTFDRGHHGRHRGRPW